MSVLPLDYGSDPDRFLPTEKFPHDDVHPYVAARFAACAANRDSDPELAGVVPDWGAASTFDGEDAEAIVASVFDGPGDQVRADPWDGPLVTLSSMPAAAAILRVHRLGEAEAARAAATLDLPLRLTKRGRVIYATKGGYG